MTRLRSLFATAATVVLITGATAAGSATAAEPAQPREPGCAHVLGYGSGWADIYNECGYTVFASVEVDGFDPPCIQIGPGAVATIGLEPGDTPYYAYEC
ncbi:hypothetical protein EJ357_14710 [Streptomyces cyaneochromogenes]|uniref:Alpha-amylase n=1 Tax=Streptomyces cyaneochromogenes TaxID=2496836 RepID=A0A3Q9ERS5_9ACTN|nr:hypothetical protein [Streptomyces cyaneochromogenes]AZQ34571.1 hypothetical protein EJ357_14710 [Streptomyces cyaneochromogenes]